MKYFIDDNIWYQGKKQPSRKVEIVTMYKEPNGKTAVCYDKDGDEYRLNLNEIFDSEQEQNQDEPDICDD